MGEEFAAARPDIAERHREIAGALKKRSRKGLTHRDLKLRKSCSLNPTIRTDSVSPAQSPPFLREHGRPIYQTSFRANWICREVVAVEVICPAPGMVRPFPSKRASLATGGLKLLRFRALK